MNYIPTSYFLYLGAVVFAIGIALVVVKKNAIMVLMGIELMLNAANINLVAFSRTDQNLLQGQMLSMFVLVVAAAEASIALALIINAYKYFNTLQLDELNNLKD